MNEVLNAEMSAMKAKGTSSADTNEPDPSNTETEALWSRLRDSERDTRTKTNQLEEVIAQLKIKLSEQMKTNDGVINLIKGPLKNEEAEQEVSILSIMKSVHCNSSLPQKATIIPMTCFNLVVCNHQFRPIFKWTIGEIETLTSQKTFELSGELFQWTGYPVRARAKLQLKEDGFVYVSLSLKDNGQLTHLRPIPQVFYLVRDKLERNPQHKCHSITYLLGSDFNDSLSFELRFFRKSWFVNSIYNVDDSLEIEVYVEPPPATQLVHSYDGTLEWTIENCRKRVLFEKNSLGYYQASLYFYTGPSGYRVRVRMFFNGTEGQGPTVYVSFLTGVFDAELPESFPHSTTVTLVNREDPERSIRKTVVEDLRSKKAYKFEIGKVEEVAKLIENDTLFCKVIVKAN